MPKRPAPIQKSKREFVVEAVTAGLASVPFAGGLAVYLDKYYPSYVKATVEDLTGCLTEHAAEIEAINCDLEQLGALISRLPSEFVKTVSETKRSALLNVVKNFSIGGVSVAADVDIHMHLASSISEHQLEILCLLGKTDRQVSATTLTFDDKALCNDVFPGISRDALRYLCTDLRQKCLIERFEQNLDAEDSPIYMSYLELTDFGRHFVAWVSAPEEIRYSENDT